MDTMNINYDQWIRDMFDACNNKPFPYPVYSDIRMISDWNNLKIMNFGDYFNDKKMSGNSIVTQFHRSIYCCRVTKQISPFQAWNTPELLLKCIENRFVYRSVLSTQQIARGFERNKLAPRITIFQPSLARYLLSKYAPEAKTVVDPFSGFSGRMLGTASLGMSYAGYDIKEETINESKQIIDFLDLKNCSVSVADFETNIDNKEYDVLLTCPPYTNKEIWLDNQNCQKADYYIEHCLRKFNAKIYVFVVDKTIHPIIEHIGRRSHMSERSKESVVVFRRG
jgi:tRNA G10  N-methylase Trm11